MGSGGDHQLLQALVEVACNFLSGKRRAEPHEVVAIKRFLAAYSDCARETEALVQAGLSGKRPSPTLNARLAFLRAHFTDAQRRDFMVNLFRLYFAIDGLDRKLLDYVHFVGAFLGFVHAHVGWLFHTKGMERGPRYAPDLYADRMIVWIDRLYLIWVVLSLGIPFLIGYAVSGGDVARGAECLVWGGLVRVFIWQHVVFSINSICHMFGRKEFKSRDESRNVWLLAPLSFGESWHNGHHAFPASARHGLNPRQLDLAWLTIRGMEKVGLVCRGCGCQHFRVVYLKRRPGPTKWSVHEHACHLSTGDEPFLARLDLMLSTPSPYIRSMLPSPEEEAGSLLDVDLDEALDRYARVRAGLDMGRQGEV